MNSEIFLDNKYTKYYYQIIERARTRKIKGEKHHIIPEAFYENRKRKGPKGWLPGDPDAKDNLVKLTAREHFIVHWLLIKMTKERARGICIYSLNGMKRENKGQKRYSTPITSRVYAKLRGDFGIVHSETMSGRTPWNKGRKETRQEVLDNIQKAALARPEQTPEQRENQAKKTRGQKRTKEQKENIRQGSLEFYKENPRGAMTQEHKDTISSKTKGVKKSKKMGKRLSSTISKQLAEGTHNTQIQVCCLRCRDVVSQMVFGRNHRDKWHS